LGGASLLVDGHAFLFWVLDQAFDDDYTQWAGGYQRCVMHVCLRVLQIESPTESPNRRFFFQPWFVIHRPLLFFQSDPQHTQLP
jgi:hypothetical protein